MNFAKDFMTEAERESQLLTRLRADLELHEKVRDQLGYKFLKKGLSKRKEIRESGEL